MGSLGTHKALGLAKAKGARFLLASTSECYGDPEVNPQPETYWGNVNPIGIRGVYDEAKRFAEAMTMAYHRHHGVDVRIVRIFNTFGPRMQLHDGRAIPNFFDQAIRGEPITVFGDGAPDALVLLRRRSGRRHLRLLRCDYVGPVNIGNPQRDDAARDGAEDHRDRRQRERDRATAACRRTIRRCAGPTSRSRAACSSWEPRVPVDEGLRRTLRVLPVEALAKRTRASA